MIGEFVDWCREGLAAAGVSGEILIIDSSTDRSPEIAAEHGAGCSRCRSGGSAGPTSTRSRRSAARS